MNKAIPADHAPWKVAVIQRTCPHYRIPLFRKINQSKEITLKVLVSDPSTRDLNETRLGFDLIHIPALTVDFDYSTKRYSVPFSPGLVKHLWQERYDIVIAEGVTNIVNHLLIYPTVRLRGSRYLWWGAGRRRFATKTVLRRVADPFVRYFIGHADACIAYGSVARDYMVSAGARPEKVFVAQNTIDTASILSQDMSEKAAQVRQQLELGGNKVVLYVGAIEERKKVENLILAYQEVISQMEQPPTLVIVGDGPHLARLQRWHKELPSSDVRFLGEIIEDVGAYFAMCDVFVLPSEGGLALNQAMAYGKPVIATSADGTEVDLIKDGENGYLVAEDDIPALAEAILQILKRPAKQLEMGKRSTRLMCEKFTLENMVSGFVSALSYVEQDGHS
jgi:glycosyltransferase involved in cell wall biosynthesis